jgi:hypothetical protein
MLKEATLRAILLITSFICLLDGKDIFGQPAAVQESVKPQDRAGTPFPSSPELRSKAMIVLVRQGCLAPALNTA